MGKLTENFYIPGCLKNCVSEEIYNSASDLSCIELLYRNVSENIFILACRQMHEFGAEKISENKIDNYRSEIFRVSDLYYFLSFDDVASELRIVVDFDCNYPENQIRSEVKTCPVRLWQLEIDHSLIDCGMCYIFQCSDFSFFVIDSAHDYSVNDDIRIYEFMRERTPSDIKVRVAGWFISHGHIDHFGKFLDILRYNKEIIIEGIYFNFAPNDHFSSESWMYSDINHVNIFYEELSKHSEIPVYRLHTGQHFFVRDLSVDILCTHEDVYPVSLDNYNDSSTVLMITVGNDKICFPGDAGGEESKILERRYPKFLQCDIMQVSHHGHFGTTPGFYRLANAKTVLFPVTRIKYDEEYPRYEANRVADEISEHNFIASDGTVEFTFPLKHSVIKLYPDEIIENFEGIYNLWSYEYSEEYKQKLVTEYKKQKGCIISY